MIGWISLLGWPAAALGLIVLQTTFGGAAGFLGSRPDFLLLGTLLVAMRRGETVGAFWGMALGFLQDLFSAGVPGLNLLSKGLVGFAAGSLRGQLDCENPNTQSIVAVAASLAEGIGHLVLLQIFSSGQDLLEPLLRVIVPATVAHGVLLPSGPALARAVGRRYRRHFSLRAGL